MKPAKIPGPPRGLSARARRLWRDVLEAYVLDDGHELALLEEALRSLDRADQARALVDEEGLLVLDRFGKASAHPGVAIERDARALFVRTLRGIGLDVPDLEPAAAPKLVHGTRKAL